MFSAKISGFIICKPMAKRYQNRIKEDIPPQEELTVGVRIKQYIIVYTKSFISSLKNPMNFFISN